MTQSRLGTVLLIDNDEGVLRALSARLEHTGYEVLTARHGDEGVAMFKEHACDLVITDLNMPRLDGIGVVHRLREVSQVPIIIITGYRKEYAKAIGFTKDVLLCEKPFSVNNLLDLIETEIFIGRQQYRAAA